MTNFYNDELLILHAEKTLFPYRIIDENKNFYTLEHRTNKDVIFKFKPNCDKKILKIYKKLTGEQHDEG